MLDFRPVPGWQGGYRTPVENLYLCGAGCHPGPGVTFLPGYNGAHVVMDAWSPGCGGVSTASAWC
jgi:phytoene dehydrogenase-like protein